MTKNKSGSVGFTPPDYQRSIFESDGEDVPASFPGVVDVIAAPPVSFGAGVSRGAAPAKSFLVGGGAVKSSSFLLSSLSNDVSVM